MAALSQRTEPVAGDLSSESRQHRQISGNRMVLKVAIEYASQVRAGLRNRVVHPLTNFLLDCPQFLPPPVAVCNAPNFEPAQTVLRTDVLESQKGK